MTGIYAIRCRKNGKVYVGKSNSIQWGYSLHKERLDCGEHVNYKLQEAWTLYGGEAGFSLVILEELKQNCSTALMNRRLKYWCDELQACTRGYNIVAPGQKTEDWNKPKRKRSKSSKKTTVTAPKKTEAPVVRLTKKVAVQTEQAQ